MKEDKETGGKESNRGREKGNGGEEGEREMEAGVSNLRNRHGE